MYLDSCLVTSLSVIIYTISLGNLISMLLVFVLIVIVDKLTLNCNNN